MKNANPWKLIAVFGGLIILFAAIKIFRSPMLEGNLPSSLTEIDSARVTELVIASAKNREPIRLIDSGGWKLSERGQVMRLEQGAAVNALRVLMNLKPERVVSKRKEKWDELGVGDSTGTRVQVLSGKSVEADLWIGRSGFTQAAGQQYGGTYTYIRITDEDEVYAVEGFLDAQFNRKADDWRDKSFLRLNRDSVDLIRFHYPADSSFVLEKRRGTWMTGERQADSTAVVSYLNGMQYRNGVAFAASKPETSPMAVITFEKGSRTAATIEAWPVGAGWTLRTSHQPDVFFEADASMCRDVLAGIRKFNSRP